MATEDERIRGERILRKLNAQWAAEREHELQGLRRDMDMEAAVLNIVWMIATALILFVLLRWLL